MVPPPEPTPPAVILPIYTYGQSVLREPAAPVDADSPELQALIDDMIETMHGAEGVGLAAPQIGRGLRLFVVDLSGYADEIREELGELPFWAQGPFAILNPEITVPADAEACDFEEGCLSIPDIRETVSRPDRLTVRFLDRHFEPREVDAGEFFARVVQHETDHLDGVLFTDKLSTLRRRLLQRRLRAMQRGDVEADYPLEPVPG